MMTGGGGVAVGMMTGGGGAVRGIVGRGRRRQNGVLWRGQLHGSLRRRDDRRGGASRRWFRGERGRQAHGGILHGARRRNQGRDRRQWGLSHDDLARQWGRRYRARGQ